MKNWLLRVCFIRVTEVSCSFFLIRRHIDLFNPLDQPNIFITIYGKCIAWSVREDEEKEGSFGHWTEVKPSVHTIIWSTVEMRSLQAAWDSILPHHFSIEMLWCNQVLHSLLLRMTILRHKWTTLMDLRYVWYSSNAFWVYTFFLTCLSWHFWHINLSQRSFSSLSSMVTQNSLSILGTKWYT